MTLLALLYILIINIVCASDPTSMLYNHQKDVLIVGKYSNIYQINLSTNETVAIAESGVGCDNINRTFGWIKSMTHYYEKNGTISGYLIADYNCHCIRHIQAMSPYNISTVYGNCSDTTIIKGAQWITTSVRHSEYIYTVADFINKSIFILSSNMSMELYDYGLPYNIKVVSYVSNTMYGSMNSNILFKYPYIVVGNIGYGILSSIYVYPNGVLFTNWGSTNQTLSYLHNMTNISLINYLSCQSPNRFATDSIVLSNGSVIQRYESPGWIGIINCGLLPYSKDDLTLYLPTKTQSITPATTRSPSITPATTYSSSITRSPSITPATTYSSSITRSPSITPATTYSSSITRSPSITPATTRSPSITPATTRSPSITPATTRSPSITPATTRSPSITPATTRSPSITRSSSVTINSSIYTEISIYTLHAIEEVHIVATYITGIVSSSSIVNGPRTITFISIINKQCGDTRDLSVYENPLQTTMVALGDICFIVISTIIFIIIGYIIEGNWSLFGFQHYVPWKKKINRLRNINHFLKKYKVYIWIYTIWMYLVPGIITACFKYNTRWYHIISCVVGVILIISAICFIIYKSINTHTLKLNALHYIDDSIEWSGHLYIVSIIDGYTGRAALFIDIAIMILLSFSTLLDSCGTLGILTITINICCLTYMSLKRSIQPKMALHGNLIYIGGQTVCLILNIINVDIIYITIITYISSIIGMGFIMFPPIYNHFVTKEKNELEYDAPILLLSIPI